MDFRRSNNQGKFLFPAWLLPILDILLIGSILLTHAYFHHVRPTAYEIEGKPISGNNTHTDTHTQPGIDPDPDPNPDPDTNGEKYEDQITWGSGPWFTKYRDKFTETVQTTENGYTSPGISITVEKRTMGKGSGLVTYYVADIYMADIEYFQSYFAKNKYGSGIRQTVLEMDTDSGALLAMTGDYYGNSSDKNHGVVIRNGILYRANHTEADVCILYYNGTMVTYSPNTFDGDVVAANGAWQGWAFGPRLLDDNGKAMKTFNTADNLLGRHPRSGVGYYEPGHYCFVLVDGRKTGYSRGLSMKEFSQLFQDLGCVAAYNLDGGKSAVMTYHDKVVNQPVGGGRSVSDCLIITEVKK
ncbi:MAG TPA: hypothetical protein DER23_06205 [Clostridiales bacterium]|jgi:hypothetical protein|nr:hypothetical protein [Clostridiales bacterium]